MDNIKQHYRCLLYWYPWVNNARILWVNDIYANRYKKEWYAEQEKILLEDIKANRNNIEICDYLRVENITGDKFDYIVLFCCFEALVAKNLLGEIISKLNAEGVLLFNFENRIGIRYFLGEKDSYTQREFDGLTNYDFVNKVSLKQFMYSKQQVISILNKYEKLKTRFYSCYPDSLYAEQICDNDFWTDDLGMTYPSDRELNNELNAPMNSVFPTLVENRLSHVLANDYLVEVTLHEFKHNIKYVKMELDRGNNSEMTYIVDYGDKRIVNKKIWNQELLENLDSNTKELKKIGIKIIDGYINEGVYQMPYIGNLERGLEYFERLINVDKDIFLEKLDKFIETILSVSEKYVVNGKKYMRKAYPEMIPTNCFIEKDDFLFFDQEEVEENVLVDSIVFRCLLWIANESSNPSLEELCKRYSISIKDVIGEEQLINVIMNHRKKVARVK